MHQISSSPLATLAPLPPLPPNVTADPLHAGDIIILAGARYYISYVNHSGACAVPLAGTRAVICDTHSGRVRQFTQYDSGRMISIHSLVERVDPSTLDTTVDPTERTRLDMIKKRQADSDKKKAAADKAKAVALRVTQPHPSRPPQPRKLGVSATPPINEARPLGTPKHAHAKQDKPVRGVMLADYVETLDTDDGTQLIDNMGEVFNRMADSVAADIAGSNQYPDPDPTLTDPISEEHNTMARSKSKSKRQATRATVKATKANRRAKAAAPAVRAKSAKTVERKAKTAAVRAAKAAKSAKSAKPAKVARVAKPAVSAPVARAARAINTNGSAKQRHSRPTGTKAVRQCACGCGGETSSFFLPGHDARLHGFIKRLADGRAQPEDYPYPATVAALELEPTDVGHRATNPHFYRGDEVMHKVATSPTTAASDTVN